MEQSSLQKYPGLKTKSEQTRYRLLLSASRIFANKGFQDATIAEICEWAKTNIASVNYHFNDKETLYLEAWRFAFQQELERYPPAAESKSDATAEQQLAARIKSLIQRAADEHSYSFAILQKEMAQPSNLLADIIEKDIGPQRLQMLMILKECLGQDATEQQIHFCHASIMGQCFHLSRMIQIQKLLPNRKANRNFMDVLAYAEHVVAFSLAGIQAIRSQSH